MAESFIGLTDLVKINDKNAADLGVSDIFNDAPFLKALAAGPASNGTQHKYLKETSAPTVGFRAINECIENSVSGDTLVTVDLKLIDATFRVDKAAADSYFKGADAFLARESKRHLKAVLFEAEKQFIYGTANNASGFTGLAQASTLDGLADANVVNAGGTTAGTGSSIYLVRTNEDGTDVMAVMGNEGEITVDEPVVVAGYCEDGAGVRTGHRADYMVPIMGWMGLQVGSVSSVVRIANITNDAGKKASDGLIAQGLALFPASRPPNLIVMNRRSLMQLQQSRTASSPTGAPAPFPAESFGIPIVVTDAIVSTEALLA